MALTELPDPLPDVPVEEQFIVGFGETTFVDDADATRVHVDTAVSTLLESLPATLLQKYVAAWENKAYFAIAVIRLNDPSLTLDDLQTEIANGKKDRKPGYAHIRWVEANAPIGLAQLNDPRLADQWALARLGADRTWTVAPPAGPRTIVAIVDSGLRREGGGLHADLDPGRVVPVAAAQPPGFFADNVDRDGHGTLLAGTIAAWADNNVGIGSPIPPAWNVWLMPVKFFEPPARPTAADAAYAIVWAAIRFFNPLAPSNEVKVINASWHIAPSGVNMVTLLVAATVASACGCLLVFAAGNDGTDNRAYPLFPANLRNVPALQNNVMSVLATDRYDAKAFFSNYGTNVDIGAPGMHVLSTGRYLVAPERYAQYSGTSAAAAYVSAGAALAFALNPGWQAVDVIRYLKASADIIPALANACPNGLRLNLGRAVYGPLSIMAPTAGETLIAGVPCNIKWTVAFPSFLNVDIAFSNGGGPYVPLAAGVPIGAGTWLWPAPPVTAAPGGRIRITPANGNFPAISGLFTVI